MHLLRFALALLSLWAAALAASASDYYHAARQKRRSATDRPQDYITPHMAELGPGGRHGLSKGFKRIVVKAGLDLQTVEGTGVRNISKRTFHALRHSFTSALANAGVRPELRMKLTGHKWPQVHRG